ncbi:MAG TPA: hypothetical protein VJI52_00610 [Candidatus Nanoarchaeia archaeon]|nr:hypothetical protein [Candidatus Nanoarchaeia archaeon]
MHETIHYGNSSRYIYPAILLSGVLLLFYAFLFKPSILADLLVSIGFFAILYYYKIKHKISAGAFLLVLAAIIVNLLGVAGLYAHFALGIVGYDKLVHFISSFAVAYALLQISTEKQIFLRYVFVIFMVMGLGAILEINEFIGTRYFGINNGGIFAMSDNLQIKSDLQRYDTYFDMITNFLGSLVAVFFVMLGSQFKNRQPAAPVKIPKEFHFSSMH